MDDWNNGGGNPRGRRSVREFNVLLTIHKILAMPCTNAKFSCKWRLLRELAKPSQGESEEVPCTGQDIIFNHEAKFQVRIRSEAGAQHFLSNCYLNIEVRSNDLDVTARRMGEIEVDLSYFAGIGKRTNRYLLQEAKCNGMLEISLWLQQTSGDNIFLPPRGKNVKNNEGVGGPYKGPDVGERNTSKARKSQTDDRNALLDTLPWLTSDLSEELLALRYHENISNTITDSRGHPVAEIDTIFSALHEQRASQTNARELDPRMFQSDVDL